VRKWGSGVYDLGGCDNWIETGSEWVRDVIRGERDMERPIFSVDIFRLYISRRRLGRSGS
jgi:hypothetical protein